MTLDPSDLIRASAISKRMTVKAHAAMREWCEACDVTPEAITGASREAWIVEARQGLMWVLRNRLGLSYPEIGRIVKRDRTTVMHGVEVEDGRRLADLQNGSCDAEGLKDC